MTKKLDWHNIGYSRAMAAVTGAGSTHIYPTLDKYTLEDEAKFIAGYKEALSEYETTGFQIIASYGQEKV